MKEGIQAEFVAGVLLCNNVVVAKCVSKIRSQVLVVHLNSVCS